MSPITAIYKLYLHVTRGLIISNMTKEISRTPRRVKNVPQLRIIIKWQGSHPVLRFFDWKSLALSVRLS